MFPGLLRNMLQIGQRDHASSGVGRRIQYDQAGFVRNTLIEGEQVERELVLLPQGDWDGDPARHPDHGCVGGKAGVWVDDLIAGVDQGQRREE